MSKRGSPYLWRAVWHAPLTACRVDPMFQGIYECKRQQGKHHLVPRCHVTNQLTRVIYATFKGFESN